MLSRLVINFIATPIFFVIVLSVTAPIEKTDVDVTPIRATLLSGVFKSIENSKLIDGMIDISLRYFLFQNNYVDIKEVLVLSRRPCIRVKEVRINGLSSLRRNCSTQLSLEVPRRQMVQEKYFVEVCFAVEIVNISSRISTSMYMFQLTQINISVLPMSFKMRMQILRPNDTDSNNEKHWILQMQKLRIQRWGGVTLMTEDGNVGCLGRFVLSFFSILTKIFKYPTKLILQHMLYETINNALEQFILPNPFQF